MPTGSTPATIRLAGLEAFHGREWTFHRPFSVGRMATNDIVLGEEEARSVSRKHASLWHNDSGWWVVDLNSTNGTYVNGNRIDSQAVALHHNDIVQFGKFAVVVRRSVPKTSNSDSPNVNETAPPSPGDHPTLWKVNVPGNRPLATPAIAGGKVLVGGGFGSHEFYAFAADTGKQLWRYDTRDDGPTAAIVEDDLVAFNTESCELEVLTLDGASVWKRWLGDPLMSMPAAASGRIFIVFPDSNGDRRHYLGCFHLRTGEEFWRQPVNGAAITAPVLAEGNVFVTTLDGTVCCFRQEDGNPIWTDARDATSSPAIWNGQCYFSRREQTYVHQEAVQNECMSSSHSMCSTAARDYGSTWQTAEYLDYTKRQSGSTMEEISQSWDTTVGFETSKGDSDITQSRLNLGHGTVAGVWSYQGSRPFVSEDRLYSCMGDCVLCLDPRSGDIIWKTKVVQGARRIIDHMLTPPVVINGKVFVCTTYGEVACLSAESGDWLWREIIGEPIIFQPAVANGRLFVPTRTGSLYCVDTRDEKDDGWFMWGGTAAHNGV